MRFRLSKRQGIIALAAGLILVAFVILPWLPLMLLTYYQTPKYVTQTAKVPIGIAANGYVYDSQDVDCSVLLTAHGPISALNPLTASIEVIARATIPTLQTLLNFSSIQVIIWGALSFPYKSAEYPYGVAIMNLYPTSSNSWSNSGQIVYLTSGQVDLTVEFDNAIGQIVRRVDFFNMITIESDAATFSYVTSLVFVSLELAIVGLTVWEIGKDVRNYKEKRYSKTEP